MTNVAGWWMWGVRGRSGGSGFTVLKTLPPSSFWWHSQNTIKSCLNQTTRWETQHQQRNYPNIRLFSEPNGRIKGIVQNNHHISMVPAQLCYPLPQQEGLTGGQDNVLPPPRLLPRVWRWVSRTLVDFQRQRKGNCWKYLQGEFKQGMFSISTNLLNKFLPMW